MFFRGGGKQYTTSWGKFNGLDPKNSPLIEKEKSSEPSEPPSLQVQIVTLWKINGWNLQITHEKKGTWSEPNLHDYVQNVNLHGCNFRGCDTPY